MNSQFDPKRLQKRHFFHKKWKIVEAFSHFSPDRVRKLVLMRGRSFHSIHLLLGVYGSIAGASPGKAAFFESGRL
jgi:hypothetical protein